MKSFTEEEMEIIKTDTKRVVSAFNLLKGGHYKWGASTNIEQMMKLSEKGVQTTSIMTALNHYEGSDLKEFFNLLIDFPDTKEIEEKVKEFFSPEIKAEDFLVKGDWVRVKDNEDAKFIPNPSIFLEYIEEIGFRTVSMYKIDEYLNGQEYETVCWDYAEKVETPERYKEYKKEEQIKEERRDIEMETHEEEEPIRVPKKPVIAPIVADVVVPPTPLGGGLDILADGLVNHVKAQVLAQTKASMDEYVAKNYGDLPTIIHVEKDGETNVVKGIVHEVFEDVLSLVSIKVPVFLTGKAGTGKNVICKQVAEALGLNFYFSNAVTQEYKITGFIDAAGHYQKTQFFDAFTKGGLFFLDEMDASVPEVLIILNAAIANGYFDFPNGKFDAHKEFRVIAAGNTFGKGADYEYTGRNALDSASLDRFATIQVGYSRAIEMAVTGNDKDLCEFFREWRRTCDKSGISSVASYRGMGNVAKLTPKLGLKKALKMCLVKNLEEEDLRIIKNAINNSRIDEKYMKAIM